MRVRYNPLASVLMLLAGLPVAFMGYTVFWGSTFMMGAFVGLGVSLIVQGLFTLNRTWLVVNDDTVEFRNWWGRTVKTVDHGLNDLRLVRNQLIPMEGGKPIGGFLANPADLKALGLPD